MFNQLGRLRLHNRIFVVMDENSTCPRLTPLIFGLWLIVGVFCIFADDQIQPSLARLGNLELVGLAAGIWNQLGATLGLILFFGALWSAARANLKPAIVCLAATGILAQCVKYSLGRVRPYASHELTLFHGPFGILNSGTRVAIDSFPSGHTAAAFAMAFILTKCWPRARWLWYLLAVGVATSRTLVNAHFPSDVILGALLGTLVCQVILGKMESRVPIVRTLVRAVSL